MDVAIMLAGAPIFRGAEPADFEGLSRVTFRRRYRRGDYLFHEGDAADSIYLVIEGEVVAVRVGPHGQEFVVESHLPGDLFGQLPAFDSAAVRIVDARVSVDTECLVVPRDAFVAHVRSHPRLQLRMVEMYSRWIRQRDLSASESAFQNLTGKVACKLLELSEIRGGSTEIEVRQQELAGMVGGSRENVNRALQRLIRQGDVRRVGRRLCIPDPARLRERYSWSAPPEWVTSRESDQSATRHWRDKIR